MDNDYDRFRRGPKDEKLMETVMDLIASTVGIKRVQIKPNIALLSSWEMFDSVALLELVLRLEDTFGLSIPDEDLDHDIFSSPEAIVAYLGRRLRQET